MGQPLKSRVHFDSANGAPLRESVRAALVEAIRHWGNPSSLHEEGRAALLSLEDARAKVAALIGARSQEMVFTSSGTEANAWALTGLLSAVGPKKRHLVISAVEHPSILQTARRMEKDGAQATFVPVDSAGRIHPDEVERALTPETGLVSIQWANAEVGTVQPIDEIAHRVRARGILIHTDAVAAIGQIPIDVRHLPVDALSLAANTFGGPSGVGALFIRKGVRISPLFVGGAQEAGRRAGTENLLGAVGMGAAAEAAGLELSVLSTRLIPLRDRLIRGLLQGVPSARLTGDPVHRLPGHVSVFFPGLDAETLVCALDLEGIAVGIGSACTARTMKASHVLKAMGYEDHEALGALTLTLHAGTTDAEVDRVLEVLPRVVARRQRVSGTGLRPEPDTTLVLPGRTSR